MVSPEEIALVAHLMRRAGFGATRDELDEYATRSYGSLVDDLTHPERFPEFQEDVVDRYYGESQMNALPAKWIYRMVNSHRPLEEKMALMWHHVFATGYSKDSVPRASAYQINTFRRIGLLDLKTILVELSKDPAMISWLDNSENHKDEPNENFGRELLELFSMGIGTYTEDDVKECARAFTGWTFRQPIPLYPAGYHVPEFEYLEDDHDDGMKTFLGETGRFNGEDIIDIIVKQPATARFISRHLYNFFVADEPQVPAWSVEPPRDPDAIETLVQAYFKSGGEIRSILRVLFNSDFFKVARFQKVKSPAELVTGTIKLVGTYRSPDPGLRDFPDDTSSMGQMLFNPPTVEGWHTGKEWIDGGTLNERINFAVDQVGDASKPGVRAIIERLSSRKASLSLEQLVDETLDLAGPVAVSDETRSNLLGKARSEGELRFGTEMERAESEARIARMLQLIVATREYQFG